MHNGGKPSALAHQDVAVRVTRTLCFAMLVMVTSCDGCRAASVEPELIQAYHTENAFPAVALSRDELTRVYIDYSLGMGEGIRANATFNDGLKRFLDGRQALFFRVGVVAEPEAINLSDPKANFLNLRNFTDNGSRLKSVLAEIAAAPGRTAVFVTDFEHVNPPPAASYAGAPRAHRIDVSAWGQVPFRTWLSVGNRIDVFAHRYAKRDYWFETNPRKAYDNWVYTLVFTPAWVLQDPDAYRKSALAYLLEAHGQQQTPDDRHFHYYADGLRGAATPAPSQGNAHEDLPVDGAAWWPGLQAFDWHEFKLDELLSFAQAESSEDRRILKGIRLANTTGFLDSLKIGIRVTDVSATLVALKEFRNAPQLESYVDAESGRVDTVIPPPTPYRYAAGTPLDSVITVTFNRTTGELGIRPGTEFGALKAPVTVRIDFVLEAAEFREPEDAQSVLSLQYSSGYRIPALAESLRLATRDLTADLIGKRVVYTSYITITH
jgi:hypothetical protein